MQYIKAAEMTLYELAEEKHEKTCDCEIDPA